MFLLKYLVVNISHIKSKIEVKAKTLSIIHAYIIETHQ
jgi:hypothetical protein